jgi:hypothetical protein
MLSGKLIKIALVAVGLLLIAGGISIFSSSYARSRYQSQEQGRADLEKKTVKLTWQQNAMGDTPCPIEIKLKVDPESDEFRVFTYDKSSAENFKLLSVKSDDWPITMQASITNVSSKVINHIFIIFDVPYSENGGSIDEVDRIQGVSGKLLYWGANTRVGAKATQRLLPGETITATLNATYYQLIQEDLKRRSVSRIKQAQLTVMEVDFEDKAAWMFGLVTPIN